MMFVFTLGAGEGEQLSISEHKVRFRSVLFVLFLLEEVRLDIKVSF